MRVGGIPHGGKGALGHVCHAWVEWLGDRDAQALLRSLLQAIDAGDTVDGLQAMVDGWRTNALRALAANGSRASVDGSVEVSGDARLDLLARPQRICLG